MPTVADDALRAEVERLAAKRDALTRARDDVTDELRRAVVRLVESGVSELQASKLAGIGRQTVRVWTAKDERWP